MEKMESVAMNSQITLVLQMLQRIEQRIDQIEAVKVSKHLTIEEVSKILSVSKDTVRRMLKSRDLAYVQAMPNAAQRVPMKELQRWIDQHTTSATTGASRVDD